VVSSSGLNENCHFWAVALENQKEETIDREDRPENEPPKFSLSLKDKTVFQGKSMTLECVVKGVPQPEVKWIRHGKEIVSKDGKYLITVRLFLCLFVFFVLFFTRVCVL
jgi:hypothetical protein